MRISSVNQSFTTSKIQSNKRTNTSFKGTTAQNEANINGKIPLVAIAILAGITLLGKNIPKIKEFIEETVKSKKQYAKIEIPVAPRMLQLDTQKLRELPKEIKRQAINALNQAISADDKQAVIRQFNIGV